MTSPGSALGYSNPGMRCGTPVHSSGYYVGSPGNQISVDTDSSHDGRVSASTPTINHRDCGSVEDQSVPREQHNVAKDGDEHSRANQRSINQPVSSKLTTRQYLVIVTICLSSMCGATFYSLLAPFFPTEGERKGISNTAVGIILASFQLIVFVTSPVWGLSMTRIGAKFMFVTGILVTSVCAILFGMLEWCPGGTVYLVMCLLVRSMEALGNSASSTASLTIAAHTFPDRVSMVMGFQQAFSSIGLMVGPPVGGVLFQAGGFMLPFVVTGVLYFLGGLGATALLPSFVAEDQLMKSETTEAARRWTLLRIPIILSIGYTALVGQAAIGFLDVTLALHLTQFSLSPAVVGLIFLIPSGLVILMAPAVGLVVDKKQNLGRLILIVGMCVAMFGFLLLGPSPLIGFVPKHELWVVIVALVVAGFGWSSMIIAFQEFVLAANAFSGPLAGGFLNERLGFDWASTVIGGFAALAVILLSMCTLWEWCCRLWSPFQPAASTQDTEQLLR